MSTPLRNALVDLDDPTKYVRVPGVCIFDEHEERDRKGKVVRRFTRRELERIAAACNRRDRKGQLSPLTLGHTVPDEPDETKQPPIVGYSRGYRVAWDADKRRWVIQTTFYVAREHYRKAATFPRVSIELWPGAMAENKPSGDPDDEPIIDPIALLRRTPQRDLGNWVYSRWDHATPDAIRRAAGWGLTTTYSRAGRAVLRYSMAANWRQKSMPDMEEDDLFREDEPAKFGAEEEAPAPAEGADMSDDEMEQYRKELYGNKQYMRYARSCHKKYGAAEGDMPPAGDPTMPPSAEEPGQYGMGYATDTNSSVPQRNGRSGGVDRYRKGGDQLLYKRLEEMEAREARRVGENWVLRLSDQEGYEMDEEQEVLRFAKAYRDGGDEACERHAGQIRRYHRPKITHRVGRIPVEGEAPRVPGYDPEDPESMPLEDQAKVLAYQKQHKLWDTPFAEIAARAMPQKYGRKGASKKGA